MTDPAREFVDRARKAQQVVNEMGFGPPKPETTPSEEYDEGQELVSITLTKKQAALVVIALMEQSKLLQIPEQIEWTRLAIGLNDMIVSPQEADDGHTGKPD